MPRLFIAQSLVDAWISAGRAQLIRDILKIPVLGGAAMDLFINPAVYFDRVDGADGDPIEIVGKVKTAQELAQMDAEHYDTSVVMGDTAYTVVPGIVAVAVDAAGREVRLDAATWGRLVQTMESIAR